MANICHPYILLLKIKSGFLYKDTRIAFKKIKICVNRAEFLVYPDHQKLY